MTPDEGDQVAAELLALGQSVALAFGVPPWVLGLARPPLHVRARTTVRRWARIAVQGWG
jgi:hypothetical protein